MFADERMTANQYIYYDVALQINDTAGGCLYGAGAYVAGDTVYLIALPNDGYLFNGWYDQNGYLVSCQSELEFAARENLSYTANFIKPVQTTPTFVWSDDHTSAVASYTNESGDINIDAYITEELVSTTSDGIVTAASYKDANGNATNRVIYTATVVIDGVPYTNTVVEYGLFAGWYKDAACTVKYTSQPGANDVKYAKLVDPAVLTVKYQLKNPTYSTDTTSRMRIVTTVDSLEYGSVGFALTYTKPSDGSTANVSLSTNKVYSKITGSGSLGSFNYAPTVFSDASKYFCAYSMDLPAALFNTALHIQPMWTTADGTVVYGTARDITASASASFVKA